MLYGLKHMLLFKSDFTANLGFQFYLGLWVNYEMMSVHHKVLFLNPLL